MPTISAKSRTIAFVVFEQTKLIDVAGPLQVFADARQPNGSGSPAYETILVSERGGPVATDTCVTLHAQPFDACLERRPDTVLVSGGQSAFRAARSPLLKAFVGEMSGHCRRLGSICLGAFVLAECGLLDGRRATTHWADSDRLARDYPLVDVRDNAIFETDGNVWTSAGVTAGIDMALAMVEQDVGRQEALRLAQMLVLYVRRTGGQRQFSSALTRQAASRSGEFDALISAILSDLSSDLTVARLASLANMSERNFARRFSAAMGCSPARFVEDLRVDAACELLQRNEARLAELPRLTGFGNPERMRRAFQRRLGIAPSEYRARFSPQP